MPFSGDRRQTTHITRSITKTRRGDYEMKCGGRVNGRGRRKGRGRERRERNWRAGREEEGEGEVREIEREIEVAGERQRMKGVRL